MDAFCGENLHVGMGGAGGLCEIKEVGFSRKSADNKDAVGVLFFVLPLACSLGAGGGGERAVMILHKREVFRFLRKGLLAGDLKCLIDSHEALRRVADENAVGLEQEKAKSQQLTDALSTEKRFNNKQYNEIRRLRYDLIEKCNQLAWMNDDYALLQNEYETFRRHAGPLARAWVWMVGLFSTK